MSAFKSEILRDGQVATLSLTGRIDSVTARDLSAALDAMIAAPAPTIVIDFAAISYIGSGGFRSLLSAAKALEGGSRLVLVGLSAEVYSVFELCGFLDLFEIFPTANDALAGPVA